MRRRRRVCGCDAPRSGARSQDISRPPSSDPAATRRRGAARGQGPTGPQQCLPRRDAAPPRRTSWRTSSRMGSNPFRPPCASRVCRCGGAEKALPPATTTAAVAAATESEPRSQTSLRYRYAWNCAHAACVRQEAGHRRRGTAQAGAQGQTSSDTSSLHSRGLPLRDPTLLPHHVRGASPRGGNGRRFPRPRRRMESWGRRVHFCWHVSGHGTGTRQDAYNLPGERLVGTRKPVVWWPPPAWKAPDRREGTEQRRSEELIQGYTSGT